MMKTLYTICRLSVLSLVCLSLFNCSSSTSTPATTLPAVGTAVLVIDGKTMLNTFCAIRTDTLQKAPFPLQTCLTLHITGNNSTSDSIDMVVINVSPAASGSYPMSMNGLGTMVYNSAGVRTDSVVNEIFRGTSATLGGYGLSSPATMQKVASNSLSFTAPFGYFKSVYDTIPTSTVQISLKASY